VHVGLRVSCSLTLAPRAGYPLSELPRPHLAGPSRFVAPGRGLAVPCDSRARENVAWIVSLDQQQLDGRSVNIGQHQDWFRAGGYRAKLLIYSRYTDRMRVISSQVHSTALPSLRLFIINYLRHRLQAIFNTVL
jgi:hypothetical protein